MLVLDLIVVGFVEAVTGPRLDRPVTEADLAIASDVASVHGVHVQGAHFPPTIDVGRVRTMATTGTGIVALLVAVTGLALLTAEGRRTDRALLQLGAPPRLHRHLAGTRALLLRGLAGAIALVISTLALSAVSRADPTSPIADVIQLPASGAVPTLVVVPLTAAAIAWAPHRRPPWQHPRR